MPFGRWCVKLQTDSTGGSSAHLLSCGFLVSAVADDNVCTFATETRHDSLEAALFTYIIAPARIHTQPTKYQFIGKKSAYDCLNRRIRFADSGSAFCTVTDNHYSSY